MIVFPKKRFQDFCAKDLLGTTQVRGLGKQDKAEREIEVQCNFNKGSADLYREFESWGVPSKLCRLEARGLGLDTLVTTCRLPWEEHDLE